MFSKRTSDFKPVGLSFAPAPRNTYNGSADWDKSFFPPKQPAPVINAPYAPNPSGHDNYLFNNKAPSIVSKGADAVGGIAGIAGAAALAAPALIPFAAATGVGYGIYKLGESFKLW